jgi:hypothetical protein
MGDFPPVQLRPSLSRWRHTDRLTLPPAHCRSVHRQKRSNNRVCRFGRRSVVGKVGIVAELERDPRRLRPKLSQRKGSKNYERSYREKDCFPFGGCHSPCRL